MTRRRQFAELIACALLAVISPSPAPAQEALPTIEVTRRAPRTWRVRDSRATGARAGRQSATGDADVRACRWRR